LELLPTEFGGTFDSIRHNSRGSRGFSRLERSPSSPENAFKTPLLEEDEALCVILSSKGSTTSSAPRSVSGASSRRNSDQLHESSFQFEDKKEGVIARRSKSRSTEQSLLPESNDSLVSVTSTEGSQRNVHSSLSITEPVQHEKIRDEQQKSEDESKSESTVISGPLVILPAPEEENTYAALFQSYSKSDTVIGTPITVERFLDTSQFSLPLGTQNQTTASSLPDQGNHNVSFS
jgi:hypothetical protein